MTLRLLIAALLLPCAALAQSRATIPVQDPVYRDIDRLIALRVVEIGLYGQRPYSVREVARITREAVRAADARPVSPATQAIVRRLHERFAQEVRELDTVAPALPAFRPALGNELLWVSSEKRGIPDDDVGFIEATLDPITSGRAGREYREGGSPNVAVELPLEYRGARLGAVVQPRLLLAQGEFFGSLEAASIALPIRNVTIEAGRQPIVWGQGMEGGLIFSSSGKPLDMLRISTDLPFRG
jgi:hypothetical protein